MDDSLRENREYGKTAHSKPAPISRAWDRDKIVLRDVLKKVGPTIISEAVPVVL